MHVLEAKLNKYKRLYVSGINSLTYKPKNKIQIILGTNGSGKSSLLKELIPNVDNIKDEYDVNGSKYIKYEHHGDIIELCYNRDTNKHSFKINNEEYNQAGLVKTQKQLINQYFNLNKDISELLLSSTNFTTMSVNERKRWFTEILSNIDYTYALNLFNKAKQRNRDLNAYIKLTKSKMLEYTKMLDQYTQDDTKEIQKDINLLNKLLAHLLEQKQPYKEINIKELQDSLIPYIKEGRLLVDSLKNKHLTKSKISQKVTELKIQIDTLTNDKNAMLDKIQRLEQLKISENDDKESIAKQINNIEDKLMKIEEKNKYMLSLSDIEDIYLEYNKILPYLTELHSSLMEHKVNDIDDYITEYNTYKNKVEQLKSNINLYKTKLNLLEEHIRHKVNDEHVRCPKCGYEFIPGLDNIEEIKKQINDYRSIINTLTEEYKDVSGIYDKLSNYVNTINQFHNYFNSLSYPIYTYIKTKTNNFNNIDNLQTILDNILLDLEDMSKYNEYQKELEELKYKLNIFNRLDDNKLNQVFDRLNQLRKDYSNLINKLNILNQDYNRYLSYMNMINKLENILTIVEKYITSLKSIKENLIRKEENKYITEAINVIKLEIVNLENKLNKIKNLNEQYQQLKEELESYNKRYIATNKLVEYLSPNKGIIAKSITSLINDILDRMNDIINRVWSYNITIQPCDIEESDLTYRFPVKVNNKIIPDVSKGSSSIREIIDLAFKIVAMEYLNMLDYPLILDEFGRTMDPVHRIKAYDLIEELSRDYFSQIYLVSHFESMYGRFINADVIILDDRNIEYNGKYNEVVEIK